MKCAVLQAPWGFTGDGASSLKACFEVMQGGGHLSVVDRDSLRSRTGHPGFSACMIHNGNPESSLTAPI